MQPYPIKQIQCPVAIIYGTVDYLTDVKWLITQLPEGSIVKVVSDYEHLDTMWATDAGELVRVAPCYLLLLWLLKCSLF